MIVDTVVQVEPALDRAAMSGLLAAATEVKEHGTFGYVETTMATPELNRFMAG